jgi:tRNA 2-thiouridine synthesizing protein D
LLPLKFSILINEGPYTHQASDSAYHFARAALDKGHEIYRVFFYHDGVHNASRFAIPPQDDRNLQKLWSEMAQEHELDLVVCVAAAQRRGILDTELQARNTMAGNNLAEGFRISGLGQLIEAGIESDRMVVFGD